MKKKIFLVTIIVTLMLCMSNVLAVKTTDLKVKKGTNIEACDGAISPNVLIDKKIPSIISTVVTVIKIAVPVLLVIFGSIDLIKGITAQKEDEIKKGQQIFVKRLISGALVFFVFTIVQFVISFVAGDTSDGDTSDNGIMVCANCLINNKNCGSK